MRDAEESTLQRIEGPPVEVTLAYHAVRRVVFIGPVLIGLFWLLRGADGALAATIGTVLVAGNLLLAGWLLSISVRISLMLYHAAALFGFFLRLGLLTATVVITLRYIELDMVAFGISAVVAYLAMLTWEAVMVARGAERELEWN